MANKPPIPKTYKGKPTENMSVREFEKMYKELGLDTPSKYSPPGDFNEEPDMGSVKKKKMAAGGSVKAFKPCASCPTPAKCKAAGKCMMKEKKGGKKAASGMLVIPVKMSSKAPAKKKK
jgi:hypothetical protein